MTEEVRPPMIERLQRQGHTVTGEFCQKCWDVAFMRSMEDTSKSQYEHYSDITVAVEAEAD